MLKVQSRVLRIEHHLRKDGPYSANNLDDKTPLQAMAEKHSSVGEKEKRPILEDDFVCVKSQKRIKELLQNILSFNGGLQDYNELRNLTKQSEIYLKFGFRTVYQLRSWFSNEDLKLLHDEGFILNVLSVPANNLLRLKKQAVIIDSTNKENHSLWVQNLTSLIY